MSSDNNISPFRMKRLIWCDRLKGYLIILVILGHALQHVLGPAYEENHLWNIIYSFHMPAFMATSGYLSGQDGRGNLYRRFLQLMIPFLVWTLILFIVHPPYEFSALLGYFLYPDKSFWFLWALFWIVALFWTGDWLAERYQLKQTVVIGGLAFGLVAAMALLKVKVFGFQFIAYYFLFYVMGYYMRKYPTTVTQNKRVLLLLTVVWVILAWFWKMHDPPSFMVNLPLPKTLLNYGYRFLTAGIAVYVLIGAGPLLLNYRKGYDKVLIFCGIWSLGIYVVHLILMPFICGILSRYGNIVPLTVLWVFLLAFGLTLIIVFLLTLTTVTREVLLGKWRRIVR